MCNKVDGKAGKEMRVGKPIYRIPLGWMWGVIANTASPNTSRMAPHTGA